mmetsp:Transcript_13987/g.19412  ORF Transcript_13987/g.19412 Transcript_13987/m.19412 type:complete len:545 (-) Transcript_13987:156-1790(-)|eukprot:CAMPEP_0184482944 /NCGR_PEP_ID=MMETSP0113_2-20130426/4546_1 /TAXON_ID=91329 /ORGANISM="Norrisiella sphaerica, Strain BC52" /LENGTH=544 /DNA_ID=CAMNT_0026863007 /DNA_START=96 /DNA_END=1730 /DNA_ORIENTATION=+
MSWSHNTRLSRAQISDKEMRKLESQLENMGFAPNDCRKALAKTNYDLDRAANILVNKAPSPSSRSTATTRSTSPKYLPPPPFDFSEDVEMEKGNFLDCRDAYGMWLEAEIVQVRRQEVLIHYCQWDSKWDEWVPKEDRFRFAPFHKLSLHGTQAKFKKDDKVVVWGAHQKRKWQVGSVTDMKNQQVKVTYWARRERGGERQSNDYWYHVESPEIVLYNDFDAFQAELKLNLVRSPKNGGSPGPPAVSPVSAGSNQENKWFKGQMVEVKDTVGKWLPAEVLKLEKNSVNSGYRIFVHYVHWGSKWDEWIDTIKNRHRVRPLGAELKESSEEREMKLKEEAFRKDLRDNFGLQVVDAEKDGNCMFRCFAHQIYGDMKKHTEVRQQCYDYMKEHRDHFEIHVKTFLGEDFDDYVARQLKPTEWGDELTLVTLQEIFNKNLEIYHQGKFEQAQNDKKEREYKSGRMEKRYTAFKDLPVVRLSFHGNNHYNSLVDINQEKFPLGDGKDAPFSVKQHRLKQMQAENKTLNESQPAKKSDTRDDGEASKPT